MHCIVRFLNFRLIGFRHVISSLPGNALSRLKLLVPSEGLMMQVGVLMAGDVV